MLFPWASILPLLPAPPPPACTCVDPLSSLDAYGLCTCKGTLKPFDGECGTGCRRCGCPIGQYVNTSLPFYPTCSCDDPKATLAVDGSCNCLPGFTSTIGVCGCAAGQTFSLALGGKVLIERQSKRRNRKT